MLEVELDRLMGLGELKVSDEDALKLKTMSSATIDRKLKHQGEVLHLLRSKGSPKPIPRLRMSSAYGRSGRSTDTRRYLYLIMKCWCPTLLTLHHLLI